MQVSEEKGRYNQGLHHPEKQKKVMKNSSFLKKIIERIYTAHPFEYLEL